MGLKSNFGAFFQDMFFLCGLTPNHLISGNILGLLISAPEMHALFRENHFLEVSTTANNRITASAVESKISSKS